MIYNFTNLFTAFVESFLSLMICKSFLKSRENMPKYIHYFAIIVLAIMIVAVSYTHLFFLESQPFV